LEISIPHINALTQFNQDMSKFAREHHNRLQRKRRARQRTELAKPFETPQEQSNRLRREQRIVQQAIKRAQPSLGNDTLQLFVESTKPSKMPQERSNYLRQEQRTIQQAAAHAQPSFGNDALQLFVDEDVSTPARWDCGEMYTICGFCNVKMWIKGQLAKSSNSKPQFSVL